MKIVLVTIAILLSLIGGMQGVQMWRFCKTHTPQEILEHAKEFESKLIIQIGLFIVVTIISIVLILTRF